MAMNGKAKRQKGRRLVLHLVNLFREGLDEQAYEISGSGAGLDKNDIRLPTLNIEVECKNAVTFNLAEDWAQVERQATPGNLCVLAVRHPKYAEFEKTLVVMDVGDFNELAKRKNEEVKVVSNFSRDLKWKITRARDAMRDVLKELE